MSKPFDEFIFGNSLPVNSLVALNELVKALDDAKTNCIHCASYKNKKVVRLMWFLMQQVFTQIGSIDMHELWIALNKHHESGDQEDFEAMKKAFLNEPRHY
jgi:hypothetical protein